MTTNNSIMMVLVAAMAAGCGAQATTGGKRGATLAQHAGAVSVVFTNASPEKMCGLRMSYDGEASHGDNWLPGEGLASGKSIEFKVKPGKYKATWNTCATSDKPYYAATLCNDWAFDVSDSTQLFAYVADTVSPTKRAAPMELYAMVKFPGQQITPGQTAKHAPAESTEVAEHRDPNAKVAPKSTASSGSFDAKDFVEKPSKTTGKKAKQDKQAIKPTLGRTVDVSNAKVKYAAR